MVRPVVQPLATHKPRPCISSPDVQSKRRNLFGTCDSADIDARLEEENKRTSTYLMERYNMDLEKLEEQCNQRNSVEAVKFVDLDSNKSALMVIKATGIKRKFYQ